MAPRCRPCGPPRQGPHAASGGARATSSVRWCGCFKMSGESSDLLDNPYCPLPHRPLAATAHAPARPLLFLENHPWLQRFGPKTVYFVICIVCTNTGISGSYNSPAEAKMFIGVYNIKLSCLVSFIYILIDNIPANTHACRPLKTMGVVKNHRHIRQKPWI